MRRQLVCGLFAVLAGVALSATGVTGVQASGISRGHGASGTSGAAALTSPSPGSQLWAARYGTTEFENTANAVKVSPDGGTVYVTGSTDSPSSLGFATIAYNATTGDQLWFSSFHDPYNLNDFATSLAVSPDGGTVYVTGVSGGENGGVASYDYATIAYNAASGTLLWIARYNGPGNGDDKASSVVVSPGGGRVFVTGQSAGTTSGDDYATVAYSAATGAQLWVARYNGSGNGNDVARSAAVSSDGKTVFVTGYDTGATSGYDYGTVAYSAATGAQLWAKHYNGPGNGDDLPFALAASPIGGAVYVTGNSSSKGEGPGYATVAYDAATGHRVWLARYNGPATLNDVATSIAVSPGGGRVFVTGASVGNTSNYDYATIAYRAPNGVQLWVKRYNGPGNRDDRASAVAVSPDGGTVYATGESPGTGSGYDYATLAYDAPTGHRLWLARYNGPADGNDSAQAAAVSPTTGTVFVTGQSAGTGTMEIDLATVAYQG
jgi:DNA-binding beta-propeller fold protein YncE